MSNQVHPVTLTDHARRLSKGLLAPIATRFHQWGVHPDVITVTGTLLVAVAAVAIAYEYLWLGGIIVLVGLPLDALDGAVARLRDKPRPFGAFLDSTLDRYADGLLFGSLAVYGEQTGSTLTLILALVALTGAFLISYSRARAEGLGLECKIGLFSRMERTIVLLALLLTGWVIPGLWILAIGTHFTALQRIWYVRNLTENAQNDPISDK